MKEDQNSGQRAQSREVCGYCHDRLHPDGVCPRCFNRQRGATILRLAASGIAVGGIVFILSLLYPGTVTDHSLKSLILIVMVLASALGGLIPAGVYALVVPAEKPALDITHPDSSLICPKCSRWMEPGDAPWCPTCSGRRLRRVLLAFGVALPLLGIGACDSMFGLGHVILGMGPFAAKAFTLALWAGGLGPLAAGLIWVIFGPAFGRSERE